MTAEDRGSLSAEIADYLARLASGADAPPWRAWCDAHRGELERAGERMLFLKLKFAPSAHVPRLLKELGSPSESRELTAILSRLDRDAATPQPVDGYGVAELYALGRHVEADERLAQLARSLADVAQQDGALRLCEMVFDAEILCESGRVDEARGLARAVAALERGDDLVDPAIFDAEKLLRSLG